MSNSDFRALVFDLDGTLLVGEDLPAANREALLRAKAAGYTIIIATARWVHMAHRIAKQLEIDYPVIACSGGQVHDPKLGRDIFDARLPLAFTKELYALCNAQRCIATVTVDEEVLLKLDGEPDPAMLEPEMRWVTQLQTDENNLPRIAAIQGSAVCAQIKSELKTKYAEEVNVFDSIGPSGKLVITITAKSATKGHAVSAACAHLGIDPQQAVAFGDAENDLAMFAVCGASVAMGQASPQIQQAATYVSAANDADGVALAVNRLLELGHL